MRRTVLIGLATLPLLLVTRQAVAQPERGVACYSVFDARPEKTASSQGVCLEPDGDVTLDLPGGGSMTITRLDPQTHAIMIEN